MAAVPVEQTLELWVDGQVHQPLRGSLGMGDEHERYDCQLVPAIRRRHDSPRPTLKFSQISERNHRLPRWIYKIVPRLGSSSLQESTSDEWCLYPFTTKTVASFANANQERIGGIKVPTNRLRNHVFVSQFSFRSGISTINADLLNIVRTVRRH